MNNKLLRIIAGALALASTTFAPQAKASGSVDLGYLATEKKADSYAESNFSTDFFGGSRLSGFMDLKENDAGYFAKTALTKAVSKNLDLRTQVVSANAPITGAGFGLSATISHMPKNVYASVNVMPAWVNSDGLEDLASAKIGYFASVSLPRDFYAWTFGEIKPFSEQGATWAYGETEAGIKLGKAKIGVNAVMQGQGDGKIIPELMPRAVVRYTF